MITTKTKTLVLGLVLLVPIISAHAQVGTKVETRAAIRENAKAEIKDIRQETRNKISSTTERLKDRIESARDVFIRIAINRYKNIVERLDATIAREVNIYFRLVSRIEKFKSAGKNTSEAEKFVAEAKIHIDAAKSSLVDFKNASTTAAINLVDSNISTSTKAKAGLKKIKDQALTVEKHIREARNSLVKAVISLRGFSNTNTSSTTISN